MHEFWCASNYLTAGQIFLMETNPLLRLEGGLKPEHIKPRLIGHWGTCPGQNFIYTHLNRLIKERELQMIYVSGPGHGGNFLIAQTYLEGTYSEYYPKITDDETGMGRLFKQFSFPGGVPSHCAPETPGSLHEGGELGYCLSHSFGAVLDKPNLTVCCVVGDGEAETGPLATSWHANKFLNPLTDGVVLPILHLNGAKIANAAFLARIPNSELLNLFKGYGYDPILIEGHDPGLMHPKFAEALDAWADKVKLIKDEAKAKQDRGELMDRPIWPMIILKTPKGWTGPKVVDGKAVEGTFRSHQVPISSPSTNPAHLKILELWLKSYEPEKLFDENGRLRSDLKALLPPPELQIGRNKYVNPIMTPLSLPNPQSWAVEVKCRGATTASDMGEFGKYLAQVMVNNEAARNFRMFSPDETSSNRLQEVFKVTKRQFMGVLFPEVDESTGQYGRVMEMLSEHQCEGLLEGYLLTGGHGIFNTYEAFVHIVDSMFNQHAKWLEMCKHIPWRNRLASLNLLLSSHVWRQDHNGFTHQDPGFLNHVSLKKSDVVRVYLPPDANCLLQVMHHCLGTYNRANVIVAGKHEAPQWLSMDEAQLHCDNGGGIWEWASNDKGKGVPHVIMACAGDVPTLEALAAVSILHKALPTLRVRFINIVDLFKLASQKEHPHGWTDERFDSLFTKTQPVVFAFHGYPDLVQKLVFSRTNHKFVVKGYCEEGTITTAFDMTVLNGLDRYHMVMDVCDLIEAGKCGAGTEVDEVIKSTAVYVRQDMMAKLVKHRNIITSTGLEMDEIRDWKWEGLGNDDENNSNHSRPLFFKNM
jgi:xylulose-5-phosphate/fructose-6-phosphate phosphoketolase